MGTPHPPSAVRLVAGLLVASPDLFGDVHAAMRECFGPISAASEPIPWTQSRYYEKELGPSPWRQFVAFESPVSPAGLARIKLRSNALEERWRGASGRRVNIDPGVLDLNKLVLASTKDAAHRIYLADGVYAEATLRFERGSFRPYGHTYRDYGAPEALTFFNAVRAAWRSAAR